VLRPYMIEAYGTILLGLNAEILRRTSCGSGWQRTPIHCGRTALGEHVHRDRRFRRRRMGVV